MNRKLFEEIVSEAVRNNVSSPRVNFEGVHNRLNLIIAAIILLCVLLLPFAILTCEALYFQFVLYEKVIKPSLENPKKEKAARAN